MSESVDDLIGEYIKLRDGIKEASKKAKLIIEPYNKRLDEIIEQLGKHLNTNGVESMKTKQGTAFFATKDFIAVEDWDAVLAYVEKTGNFELFTKAVKKDVAKTFMEDNEGNQIPGTSYGKKIEVQVRSPAR